MNEPIETITEPQKDQNAKFRVVKNSEQRTKVWGPETAISSQKVIEKYSKPVAEIIGGFDRFYIKLSGTLGSKKTKIVF